MIFNPEVHKSIFDSLSESAQESYNFQSKWLKKLRQANGECDSSTMICNWSFSTQRIRIAFTQFNDGYCTPHSLRINIWLKTKNGKWLKEYEEIFEPAKKTDYQDFFDLINNLINLSTQKSAQTLVHQLIKSSQRSIVNKKTFDDPAAPDKHWSEILIWIDPKTNYSYRVSKEYFDPNSAAYCPINHIVITITAPTHFLGIKYQHVIYRKIIINEDLIRQLEKIIPSQIIN